MYTIIIWLVKHFVLWNPVGPWAFSVYHFAIFLIKRPLACIAIVPVRFRIKERGTKVKDGAKNGASERARIGGGERKVGSRSIQIFARPKQKISFVSYKRLSSIMSNVTNRKRWKTFRLTSLKTAIAMRFNLLQFCPSVLSFVFAVLLLPSFNVWAVIFVLLNLVVVFTVWIIIKFRHTTP